MRPRCRRGRIRASGGRARHGSRGWPARGGVGRRRRRVRRAARQNREEERERETDRWAWREIFIFFLFFPWAVTNDVTKPRCVKGHMS